MYTNLEIILLTLWGFTCMIIGFIHFDDFIHIKNKYLENYYACKRGDDE